MTQPRFGARSLLAAYALDLLLGDPRGAPHPVRAIGAGITHGERLARRHIGRAPGDELLSGMLLAVTTISTTFGVTSALLKLTTRAHRKTGMALAVLLAQTTLATHDLLAEVRDIARALERSDLPCARKRLARVVGRDTAHLDETEIARAAIETLAESACDGVIAPLCALALAGVPGATAYKAISTLDSMIGHLEQPYTFFGRASARIDDIANFIPARLTALLIIAATPDAPRAWRVWRADGDRHRSPNAGQSEAAMAGALGVYLGGPNAYDGITRDAPRIGAGMRQPRAADIRAALRVTLTVSITGALLASAARHFIQGARR